MRVSCAALAGPPVREVRREGHCHRIEEETSHSDSTSPDPIHKGARTQTHQERCAGIGHEEQTHLIDPEFNRKRLMEHEDRGKGGPHHGNHTGTTELLGLEGHFKKT